MTAHLQQIFWLFLKLWELKISILDKPALFKKSINLYISFIAFTDKERSLEQLYRAMVCALISAIYDYETDVLKINKDNFDKSVYLLLLKELIEPVNKEANDIAIKLFKKDHSGKLSKSGIERGGVALHFYNLVIGSKWMSAYSKKEIIYFGEMLQILDDLIDLYNDYINGDKNCFLEQDIAKEHAEELKKFLKNDFWEKLKKNFWLYNRFGKKIEKTFNLMGFGEIGVKELFFVGRPSTGIFASLLTIIGFKFYPEASWFLIVFTSLAFFVITTSIMIHNDLVDGKNDCKKGKFFAYEHKEKFKYYDVFLGLLSLVIILFISTISFYLAIFLMTIWLAGILYSHMRGLLIFNQLVVAICSGSPALCGLMNKVEFKVEPILIFLIFSSLIFINETYKDIEDKNVDEGYKKTMPTRFGHIRSVFYLFGLCSIPVTFLVVFPGGSLKIIAVLIAFVQFRQALLWLHPERIAKNKKIMRFVLKALIIVLII